MENLQTDRMFGNFIIKNKLGSGGMATVFRAIHSQTQQEVALKILHEHYADDAHIRKRLEHEANIAMRLDHPYIVPVWDFGEVDHRPYLVMPYLSGGSLAASFQKPRAIKHETTLKILGKLASALDYAHAQQVVHRDFKLENILLDENKIPAISDFGIAQSAHTTRITLTGQILGTPQYLAPENVDNNGTLNYKSDLYALAVMAYLMLTGYFPYTAQDPISLVVKHRTEMAPPPTWVNKNLPTTLDSVFSRGLAKDPAARYPSAEAFVEALEYAFLHAALVTTHVFLYELNPVPASPVVSQNDVITRNDINNTHVFESAVISIPKAMATPMPPERKSPKLLSLSFFALLLCTATSWVLFYFSSNMYSFLGGATGIDAEVTIDPVQGFLQEDLAAALENDDEVSLISEEASPSPSPTASPSPTGTLSPTPSPTISPSPTRTRNSILNPVLPSSTPTIVPSPTRTNPSGNIGGPAPTNTRRPQATAIPSRTFTAIPSRTFTSIPPTPIPPTPVPPTPIPPTPVPPTPVPPTPIPPTPVPPTPIPPTPIPPTDVPPTDPPPPTNVPPTDPPPPTNPPPTDPPSGEEGDGGVEGEA